MGEGNNKSGVDDNNNNTTEPLTNREQKRKEAMKLIEKVYMDHQEKVKEGKVLEGGQYDPKRAEGSGVGDRVEEEEVIVGCPQCAVIQSIPAFGIAGVVFSSSFRIPRLRIPLLAISTCFAGLGVGLYRVTRNPTGRPDFYTQSGFFLGAFLLLLSVTKPAKDVAVVFSRNNLFLAGLVSQCFFGGRSWFLHQERQRQLLRGKSTKDPDYQKPTS